MTPGNAAAHRPTVWIMRTIDGWYQIWPSARCKPEDHGALNDHVVSIEDIDGNVLWTRESMRSIQ